MRFEQEIGRPAEHLVRMPDQEVARRHRRIMTAVGAAAFGNVNTAIGENLRRRLRSRLFYQADASA